MKNSQRLIILVLSLATPAICACLLANREFSADLLLGAYTIAGLFFLTAADYLPRHSIAAIPATRKRNSNWIRYSLARTPRKNRAHREEKILA